MSTNAQETLADAAWVRKHVAEGEDPVELLTRKRLNDRLEHSQRQKDYWEGQILACEKALDKLDKA
jgi:hypothetical protein